MYRRGVKHYAAQALPRAARVVKNRSLLRQTLQLHYQMREKRLK